MLKDLLLSITTPRNMGRSASKSPLTWQFPAINEKNEEERSDMGLRATPAKRRRLPKRRLSIGDSFPRSLRNKKSHSLPGSNESSVHMVNSRFAKSSTSLNQTKADPMNILVVGARNVGKSALTVRFITRRYIGEYMSGETQTYDYHTTDEKHQQNVVFLDESNDLEGKSYLEAQLSEENLSWADGIMLVYDVGDIATFEYAKSVIDHMTNKVRHGLRQEPRRKKLLFNFKPLLLIGNKTDLVKRRSVSEEDVKQASQEFPSWVTCDQMSAAEGYDDVGKCVNELISKVRERRRFMSGLSTKENFKNIVGSVLRHKSLKLKSRSV